MNIAQTFSTNVPNPTFVTPEQLLAMPDGDRFELVSGNLVELHVGFESNWLGLRLARLLGNYVEPRGLGWIVGYETGFRCYSDDPDKIRKPDVAFVGFDRVPPHSPPAGYCDAVPQLVVEVTSPKDRCDDLDAKISEYLAAGVDCVWVVEPSTHRVRVYYPDRGVILSENDELSGDPVIPGFRCSLKELFTPPSPPNTVQN